MSKSFETMRLKQRQFTKAYRRGFQHGKKDMPYNSQGYNAFDVEDYVLGYSYGVFYDLIEKNGPLCISLRNE